MAYRHPLKRARQQVSQVRWKSTSANAAAAARASEPSGEVRGADAAAIRLLLDQVARAEGDHHNMVAPPAAVRLHHPGSSSFNSGSLSSLSSSSLGRLRRRSLSQSKL